MNLVSHRTLSETAGIGQHAPIKHSGGLLGLICTSCLLWCTAETRIATVLPIWLLHTNDCIYIQMTVIDASLGRQKNPTTGKVNSGQIFTF